MGSHIQSILSGVSGETASKLGWNLLSTLHLSAFKVWTCACSMYKLTVSVSFCVISPVVSGRQFPWCPPFPFAFRTFLLPISHYYIIREVWILLFVVVVCLFIFIKFYLLGSWVLSFILIYISLSANDV